MGGYGGFTPMTLAARIDKLGAQIDELSPKQRQRLAGLVHELQVARTQPATTSDDQSIQEDEPRSASRQPVDPYISGAWNPWTIHPLNPNCPNCVYGICAADSYPTRSPVEHADTAK